MLVKLWSKSAKTQEEFKERLAGRQKWFRLLAVSGIASLAVGLILNGTAQGAQAEYLSGLYCGMGIGIMLASIFLLTKDHRTLQDEKKIRQQWLEESDERNRALNERAFFMTGAVSFFLQYIIFLFAGFFSMDVLMTLWGMMMFYALGFVVIRKILSTRM